ncbi:MAG: TatD family hydrolase [Anaerolineae bacterium]|nr:TatD family hydrolase [Anaerolineae bacterium]
MTLVDTHCHLNFNSYDDDRQAVIDRAAQAGVTRIINPGIDLESSQQAVDLAATHEGIYAAVGIHPNSSADFTPSMLDEIRAMAATPGVVAIGEIGLDYHWDKSPKSQQFAAFEAQLALASELALPVIIHNREASEDLITILEEWAADLPDSMNPRPGVLHSFSAPPEIAERALAAGFYLGFTGPITFKNADELRSIAHDVPLDRLLVETDGPFLTPMPYRGKRNEPAYIPFMVERLAGLKQMTDDAMGAATTENAVRLFQFDSKTG